MSCGEYQILFSRNMLNFEGGHYCLLPTICPLTKTKPRRVCCQEEEDDENMTPSDMTIDYKVSSFLRMYSDFLYNLFGSTCTCHYLFVGTHVSQNASLSMYSSIQCVIEELHRHHGRPTRVGSPIQVKFESASESRSRKH